MKTNYLKFTPVLLVALFASSNASALSYGGTAVGGNGGDADHQQYTQDTVSPFYLVPNNVPDIVSVINVNGSGNTGNTELFASSDSMDNTTWFGAYKTGDGNTSLNVDFTNGSSMILSSLNANDWDSGLLLTWSTDILTKFAPGFTGAQLTQFMNLFVLYEGEQQLSDPNIQSINVDGSGTVNIGLAGFLDASVANDLLPQEVVDIGLIPKGAQISEIVKATAFDKNGAYIGFQYLYAIGMDTDTDPVATASGVQTADGSYNANFILPFKLPPTEPGDEVDVPEPTGLALLLAGLTGFFSLRRKAVKA